MLRFLLEVKVSAPGRSPSMVRKGVNIPLDFSVRLCATLILDAATIFMALVIFAIFCTDRIRCLTAKASHTSPGWIGTS